MKEKKEKIHYNAYSYRLNKITVERIAELKKKEMVSFNCLFIKLLDKYENTHRRLHNRQESKQ